MAKKHKGVTHIKDDIYRIDYQVKKTRKQQHIKASSIAEAKDIRDERIVDLRKNLKLPQDEQARFNAGFDEAWEKLKTDLCTKPHKTLLRFQRTFWRIFGEFREKSFPHIKSIAQAPLSLFAEYIGYYVGELGHDPNGGLRAEIIIMKTMMRRLYRLGYCSKNILNELEVISKPKQKQKGYPEITVSQLNKMFSFIKKDRPDYYRPLIFICRTGRRIEETTLIEKRDIKWLGLNPISIDIRGITTKTGEEAPIKRLDEDLQQLIKEAYKASVNRKSVFLFLNKRGKKCTSGRIRDYLKTVSQEILKITLTPHYFRHRFLTECGKSKAPLADLMAISGLKDVDVLTRYYSHSTKEGQDKVLEVTRV